MTAPTSHQADVLLVGGGVMSATLGMMLHQLDPSLHIVMVERLEQVAHESTDGWNNAGTGHAGYCELNYTPETADGEITIDRALQVNSAFELSLQFWSHLVETGVLPDATSFINPTPHHSFVWGEKDVAFLRHRHQRLSAHHLFREMQFSESLEEIAQWMPLIMRKPRDVPVAATKVAHGADVDFGSLTRHMIRHLESQPNFELLLAHPVRTLKRERHGHWHVEVRDTKNRVNKTIEANFVFLGAGGGALHLLQKSGIKEAHGYGGFPVSGQWLVCQRPDLVDQHHAKVYGKAPMGAPPMSVPHLDTRIINGQPALLFGPYAGFTMRFMKSGSMLDLFNSVRRNNLLPMVTAGGSNLDLTRYLIGEVFQSHRNRVKALRNFVPDAEDKDWALRVAGQRVQIIKQDGQGRGMLKFGTEIVAAEDGSLAALLGASPGASTAANAMLDVVERCFAQQLRRSDWQERLHVLFPSFGQSLIDNEPLLETIRDRTLSTLGLRR